jgi:hypothetical protein
MITFKQLKIIALAIAAFHIVTLLIATFLNNWLFANLISGLMTLANRCRTHDDDV